MFIQSSIPTRREYMRIQYCGVVQHKMLSVILSLLPESHPR